MHMPPEKAVIFQASDKLLYTVCLLFAKDLFFSSQNRDQNNHITEMSQLVSA